MDFNDFTDLLPQGLLQRFTEPYRELFNNTPLVRIEWDSDSGLTPRSLQVGIHGTVQF